MTVFTAGQIRALISLPELIEVKVATVFPDNQANGLPAIRGEDLAAARLILDLASGNQAKSPF